MSNNRFIEIDGYRINIANIEYIWKLTDGSGDVAIHFVSGRHIMIKSYDAVKTATHNFPEIEQRGDVFDADFTEFRNFDYLMGGSPCTYWSIAQKNNRETEASGLGWELFSQYVRALREAHPKYFIYENNKSMSNAIRESITSTFGFEPICINSALLSAQNRQRLYWVGKRNADGTYSKVEIEQPVDKGILLKDILEDGIVEKDKSYCLKHQAGNARDYFKKHHTQIKFEPVATRIPEYGNPDKARELGASYAYKGSGEGSLKSEAFPDNPNKQVRDYVAEPVRVGSLPINIDKTKNLKSNDVYIQYDLSGKGYDSQDQRAYYPNVKHGTLTSSSTQSKTGVIEPICYANPIEWGEEGNPIKATSYADGKTYKVYEVKRGFITINGKEYLIKLADGYYIIRKLTVRECMRLQTVPEWYDFSVVSDTQAYKMLGNGWTVAVISYLLNHTIE